MEGVFPCGVVVGLADEGVEAVADGGDEGGVRGEGGGEGGEDEVVQVAGGFEEEVEGGGEGVVGEGWEGGDGGERHFGGLSWCW